MAAERKPPTSDQFFGSMFSHGQSKKDTEEKAIPCKILHVNHELSESVGCGVLVCNPQCKILHGNHELSESVGCGVLVCNPQFDKSRKHFIITSKRVIENENFADECKVEFKRNSKVRTFDLKGVKKSVLSVAFGVIIIFIDSQNIKHIKYQKFPLTIANFDQNQTPFCYVANQCYNIESDHENGKYVLKRKNSDTSADQLTNATSKEMSNGTVILQGSGKENMKAVGIFNMEDATQMLISPIWLKPSITDILAPTTDSRQMSSPTDTVAVTATTERQSTVGSGGTTANTTHNQESPAAGTHQATEATANPQQTAGVTDTNPGAPPASELSPARNGPDGVDDGARASENDDNNAAPPSSTGDATVRSGDTPANTTNNQELPAAGSDHTTEAAANQQPTGGANGNDGVEVDASASSSSAPVQEEQGEETANQQPTSGANGTDDVDVDASASENDQNNGTQQPGSINSPPDQEDQGDVHTRAGEEIVSEKDKSLLHYLAVELDKTAHRVVKDWEYLANIPEINAPLHVRLRCRIRTERSCTLLLFDVLRTEFAKKTLENMIDALEEIKRRDVKRIITDCMKANPDAVYRTMNFWEFDIKNRQLVCEMSVMLDQKSLVNNDWRHLGGSSQFKLTGLRLEEIEQSAQIGGQPTQILMAYLYSEVQNLTIKTFYDVIKNFDKPREDVLKKLDQFMDENPIFRDSNKHMKEAIDLHGELMRDICVLFNKKIPGVNNWRHLAGAFGVPEEVKKDCEPGKPKSPTETLFQWIFAEKDPPLTVGQLCKALEGIKRIDLVNVVKHHFKK